MERLMCGCILDSKNRARHFCRVHERQLTDEVDCLE